MSYIHINRFHGIAPRIAPRKLDQAMAQVARNVDIFSQELRALRTNIQVNTPTKVGEILSIYLLGDLWLHWITDVDVMRSPLYLENQGRIHYTGDYNPKSTDADLADASPGTDYPTDFYRLGVPRPDTAPTVSHTGGTGNAIDRSYVYTFVTAWGEEGPPSPETTYTGVDDATQWDLSGIDATPVNTGVISDATPGASTVALEFADSHFLETTEYITISGTIVATGDLPTDLIGTFQVTRTGIDTCTIPLVTNGVYTSGGVWTREAPLQLTGWTKRIYRSLGGTYKFVDETTTTTYTDTKADEFLGEDIPGGILEADWWKAPNGNMEGIKALANGVTCGFFDNVLAMTPAGIPSAWPEAYQVNFDFDIVGIGVLGNTVIVTTTGTPYAVNVDDPAAAVSSKLEFFQPCISKRSIKGMQNGILYVCPDGVAYVPSAGMPTVITKSLAKKKDWDNYNPDSMLGAVYDDRYYLFYRDAGEDANENGAFIFDPQEPDATFTQLTGLVTAAHTVIETDTLYLMDDEQGTISRFDSGGDFQTYQWLSKQFTVGKPTCMKAAKVKFTIEDAIGTGDSLEAIAAAVAATTAQLAATVINPVLVVAFWEYVVEDAPVAYYRHEAGALEIDSSGNDNHATTTNNVTEALGDYSGAGDYNGTDAYQEVPNDATIDNLQANSNDIMTVEALIWVDTAQSQTIISKQRWQVAEGWRVEFWNRNVTYPHQLNMVVEGGFSDAVFHSTTEIPTGEWLHLVIIGQQGATSTSGVRKIYINGVSDTIQHVTNIGGARTDARNMVLGDLYNTLGTAFIAPLDGKIDELAVYDYRLPQKRVEVHAAALGYAAVTVDPYVTAVLADTPMAYYRHDSNQLESDYSDYANDCTTTTNVTGVAGTIDEAGSYNGASSVQYAPSITPNTDLVFGAAIITIEAIINITSLAADQTIISKGRNTVEGFQLLVGTGGDLQMFINYGTTRGVFKSPAATISTGTWYHIVVIAQGNATSATGVRKIYVDNVSQTITHTSDPVGAQGHDTAYTLKLGVMSSAGGADTAYLNGVLDEVAIYNSELSAARIAAHFALTGL